MIKEHFSSIVINETISLMLSSLNWGTLSCGVAKVNVAAIIKDIIFIFWVIVFLLSQQMHDGSPEPCSMHLV